MKTISNADFDAILAILDSLSIPKGRSVKECEAARKAALQAKRLRKKTDKRKGTHGRNN